MKRNRTRKQTPILLTESQALVRAMQPLAAILADRHPHVAEVRVLLMALAALAGTFNGQPAHDEIARA